MELSKTFDSKSAEERWFEKWVELGYFTADPKRGGPVFSIVIPPPNVTGQLHLGHALNVTLHDVVVRTRRMQGFNTLWLPGTDHAGIATQNVVERELAKEGANRHQLGRDAFVERVWKWRETYGSRIMHQLRRLGASCDWSRERFTLDPELSRAVTEAFVRLYKDGLIYRDRRLINWCPRCETALSDLEVDHRQTDGRLWYIRYPFAEGAGSITVATTRPETMLGDTAVAVNPSDYRYRQHIGKKLRLPLLGRELALIADEAVDPKFGTGAVKVTPAHDPADFEIGRRHDLPQISVMDEHARMNAEAGAYAGLSREECRKRVVEDLERDGLLEKVEPHQHAVGVCSRCDTVAEPMLSWQWFVKTKPLAEPAIAAVREGRTVFHPKFWENTYFGWMENIHDWCISRQLWWGHRIPAWWCDHCGGDPIVALTAPDKCPKCGGSMRQDEDVLDTWFSSGMWPFSTLGWPDNTEDLKTYYPTSLLVTGFDIIFFWVARMMMLGLKFMDDAPFRAVYITPLVRDQFGKKMTKSRGNVVDPLEIVDRYGTDAVRFTLAQLAVQGRDLILSDDRLAASRAFANKIWNAARFVMLNLEGAPQPLAPVETDKLRLAERWILDRLDNAIHEVTRAIEAYEFNLAALTLYQFIWHEFCDWYIELSKEPLKADDKEQVKAARWVLVRCLDQLLRLLHPFMPFISEEIWQVIWHYIDAPDLPAHLAIANFPVPADRPRMSDTEQVAMTHCIEATSEINSLRSLLGWHPGERPKAFYGRVGIEEIREIKPYIMTLAKLQSLDRDPHADGARYSRLDWGTFGIEASPNFDLEKARASRSKKLEEIKKLVDQHARRLDNPEFNSKASEDIRQQTTENFVRLKMQQRALEEELAQLNG